MTLEEIKEGLYKIIETRDGEVTWIKYYLDPVEAATDYLKFTDYGTAKWERFVELQGPDGSMRTKRFSVIEVTE